MAKFRLSLNMEYSRSAEISFEEAVKGASEMGYKYIEPMVHTGWGLLSEVGFFHSFSMEEDPLLMKEICDRYNVKVGSISGHSPLMKPEAAVARLTRAIVYADVLGAPFVNTDEMIKPDWMDDDFAHQTMKYTLTKALLVAERHKISIGVEPHGIYTRTANGLMRIVNLVDSPWIGVNWDTGNSYLAGVEDPYEGLEKVREHVVHMHAKDISYEVGEAKRGKVTGTPTGCACGDGVVEWERVFKIMEPVDREIILSVECGSISDAKRSINFFQSNFSDLFV